MIPLPRYPLRAAAIATALCFGASGVAQTVSPPTQQEPEDVVVLSPFQVNTSGDRGYASSNSMGGSRISIPIGDLSSSVIVVNEQFLRDRAAVDATEALTYVSGVQRGGDLNPGQEQFSLRGFAILGIPLRDGLPEPFTAADQPYDDGSAYERIEIIKGPAGTLYGAQTLGGVINKVSKWPKFSPETRAEFMASSYDEFYRAMVDSTGPLTDKLAYRVVLSARKGDRYFDEGDAPNDFNNASGALTYHLGRHGTAGKLWARGQYLDLSLDRENGWQFITGYLNPASPTTAPLVKNGKFPVSPRHNTVPEDDISKARIYALEAGYEKLFPNVLGGDWTLRAVLRSSDGQGDKSPSYAQGRPVPVDSTGAIVRYTNAAGVLTNGDNRFIGADDPRVADWRATLTMRDFRGHSIAKGVFIDLAGDLHTGKISHKLVLSASGTEAEVERAFFFWAAANPTNTTAVANSFSAINPTPTTVNAASIKGSAVKQFNAFTGNSETRGRAIAFQDNIGFFNNRVILALGARRDDVEITNNRFDPATSLAQDRFVVNPALRTQVKSSADTFKFGAVVKPIEGLSIFAQHSETFTPISSLGANGNKNPDQAGENDEIGFKTDLFDGRLIGTLSFFEMKLTNVLLQVVNPPELGGGFVLRPVGVQKTDGYEMDIAAEPLPGLNLMLAYSKITSIDKNGRFFRSVPINANYGFFARYSFQNDALKGWTIGGGWKHNGKAAGDAANTFFLPGNDTVDAFVGYERGRWGLQLNVYNLADTDAMMTAVIDRTVVRALARTYRLTVRYRF